MKYLVFLWKYYNPTYDLWNFTVFEYRSDSPQVKGNFISFITNFVHELPHSCRMTQGLVSKKTRKYYKNQIKVEAFTTKTTTTGSSSHSTRKSKSKPPLQQSHRISPSGSKYPIQGCLRKQMLGQSKQSPCNLNYSHFYKFKAFLRSIAKI